MGIDVSHEDSRDRHSVTSPNILGQTSDAIVRSCSRIEGGSVGIRSNLPERDHPRADLFVPVFQLHRLSCAGGIMSTALIYLRGRQMGV